MRSLSLAESSVNLILTHPPYANIVKYSDGENPADLSSIPNLPRFLDELELGVKEMFRVLKPNRYCAILIGDTRKAQHYVPLSHFLLQRCLTCGFVLKEQIIKTQHNTKYAGRWKGSAGSYGFTSSCTSTYLFFANRNAARTFPECVTALIGRSKGSF